MRVLLIAFATLLIISSATEINENGTDNQNLLNELNKKSTNLRSQNIFDICINLVKERLNYCQQASREDCEQVLSTLLRIPALKPCNSIVCSGASIYQIKFDECF